MVSWDSNFIEVADMEFKEFLTGTDNKLNQVPNDIDAENNVIPIVQNNKSTRVKKHSVGYSTYIRNYNSTYISEY